MNKKTEMAVYSRLGISSGAYETVIKAEEALVTVFRNISDVESSNQARVLYAFQQENISARHFSPSYGYGYDDIGRDALDRVFARSFNCEDAIVRPYFVSGTHAIFTALCGLLRQNDTILSITGRPYDTLEDAIGVGDGEMPSSLKHMGVRYKQIELDNNGSIDTRRILDSLDSSVKVVYVQRSRGYAWRNSIMPHEMKEPFNAIKSVLPQAAIVVDNWYGEFTCIDEPSDYGADILVGSLIKNPGGGIAPTGGYIAGRRELIERVANRVTVPGIGREVGSYAASYIPFYQGLFMAPHVTAQALKTSVLFARVFEELGMITMPSSGAKRSDIVQALRFEKEGDLIAFCRSIQKASPVDSFVVPEPWDMPGYSNKVIMAAGAFIQGASIELSADAPIKQPYTAYLQGGLTYSHGRIGAMMALDALRKV